MRTLIGLLLCVIGAWGQCTKYVWNPITEQMDCAQWARPVQGAPNLITGGAIPFVASVPGAVTFVGTGINDMAVAGVYIGAAAATYCAKVDAAATPDTFSWGTDAACGNKAKAIAMTGAAQGLEYGLFVTFKADTGHTLGDKWSFSVSAPAGTLAQDPTKLSYDPATKTLGVNILRLPEIETPDAPVGTAGILWSEEHKGFSVPLFRNSTGPVLQFLRDNVTIVRNDTKDDLTKGTVVYITGQSGNVPAVAPAQADSMATLPAMGVLTEDIAANGYGRMMGMGALGLDTSIIEGAVVAAGDRLWVSAATAGKLTNEEPGYPAFSQRIGLVLVEGVGNGLINIDKEAVHATGLVRGVLPAAGVIPVATGPDVLGPSGLSDDGSILSAPARSVDLTDPTALAVEVLSEPDFATSLLWTPAADFSIADETAVFSYNTGMGTLTQLSTGFQTPMQGMQWYLFGYTISAVTGTPVCVLTNTIAVFETPLDLTEGAHTVRFMSAAVPGDFVLSCSASEAATVTFDDLSLRKLTPDGVSGFIDAWRVMAPVFIGNLIGQANTVGDISSHASTELSDGVGLVRGAPNLIDPGTPVVVNAEGTVAQSTAVPIWRKYSLVAIAHGVNGCDNADISAAVFTGLGLNDATSGGSYSSSGDATYTAIIDGIDSIKTHALNAGGADYEVDDTFTVDTGSMLATGRVTEIGALGTVTSYVILTAGRGYPVANGVATTATFGIGTGLTIDITAVADTFKWQKGAGAFTENVAMTGIAQTLADGVTIAFAAIVGHTLADQWVITVTDMGCWQVNGVLNANKAADVVQDVVLFELPARGHVSDWRIKTAVSCTGTPTAETGLGTSGNNALFRVRTYDIQVEVANTNMTNGPTAGAGSHTHAATNVVASLVTTMANIDQLVVGCAVDYWLLWAVLP